MFTCLVGATRTCIASGVAAGFISSSSDAPVIVMDDLFHASSRNEASAKDKDESDSAEQQERPKSNQNIHGESLSADAEECKKCST